MNKQVERAACRMMLRVAKAALQRIRDYEPGPHCIARDALEKMDDVSIGLVDEDEIKHEIKTT